jgi:hypothetical protein
VVAYEALVLAFAASLAARADIVAGTRAATVAMVAIVVHSVFFLNQGFSSSSSARLRLRRGDGERERDRRRLLSLGEIERDRDRDRDGDRNDRGRRPVSGGSNKPRPRAKPSWSGNRDRGSPADPNMP